MDSVLIYRIIIMYTLKWFIIIERAKHSDSALKLCFFSIIRNTHKPKVSSKFKNSFLGKAHSEACNAIGRLSLACSCLVIGANVSGTCCFVRSWTVPGLSRQVAKRTIGARKFVKEKDWRILLFKLIFACALRYSSNTSYFVCACARWIDMTKTRTAK